MDVKNRNSSKILLHLRHVWENLSMLRIISLNAVYIGQHC